MLVVVSGLLSAFMFVSGPSRGLEVRNRSLFAGLLQRGIVSGGVLAVPEIPEVEGREGVGAYLYITLHCLHQNDSTIRWTAMSAAL